jgi:hypothetical protein
MIAYRNSSEYLRSYKNYNRLHQRNIMQQWSNVHPLKNSVKHLTDDVKEKCIDNALYSYMCVNITNLDD